MHILEFSIRLDDMTKHFADGCLKKKVYFIENVDRVNLG